MPYNLNFFKEKGIYVEKSVDRVEFSPDKGKVISNLPQKLMSQLNLVGGANYNGDFSRQDAAVITSLLLHGISPEDVFATFAASRRGEHARERKEGHFEDYLQRTISKACGFLKHNGNGHIHIDFSRQRKHQEGEGIISLSAKDVEVETPRWVWEGFIPLGKLTVLSGDPGLGKSTIMIDIVSRITRGTFLPVGGRTSVGTCVIASAEDSPEDTTVPRLIAAHANLDRVHIMRNVMIDEQVHFISFPRDLNEFRKHIKNMGARLAVIDPLNAFLGKETDSHKDQDVRLVLAPFEDIAEETDAAIVVIAHRNKKEDASALYRIGGSIGIVGAARSVLSVVNIPDKESNVMFSLKSNLSRKPKALEYKTQSVIKIRKKDEWKGEDKVVSSGIDWMGEIDFDPVTLTATDKDKAENTAISFLRQIMSDSEVPTEDIFQEAKKAGISKSLVMRSREALDIQSIKRKDKWYWRLPDE